LLLVRNSNNKTNIQTTRRVIEGRDGVSVARPPAAVPAAAADYATAAAPDSSAPVTVDGTTLKCTSTTITATTANGERQWQQRHGRFRMVVMCHYMNDDGRKENGRFDGNAIYRPATMDWARTTIDDFFVWWSSGMMNDEFIMPDDDDDVQFSICMSMFLCLCVYRRRNSTALYSVKVVLCGSSPQINRQNTQTYLHFNQPDPKKTNKMNRIKKNKNKQQQQTNFLWWSIFAIQTNQLIEQKRTQENANIHPSIISILLLKTSLLDGPNRPIVRFSLHLQHHVIG
jgi:hypothetical protein